MKKISNNLSFLEGAIINDVEACDNFLLFDVTKKGENCILVGI